MALLNSTPSGRAAIFLCQRRQLLLDPVMKFDLFIEQALTGRCGLRGAARIGGSNEDAVRGYLLCRCAAARRGSDAARQIEGGFFNRCIRDRFRFRRLN